MFEDIGVGYVRCLGYVETVDDLSVYSKVVSSLLYKVLIWVGMLTLFPCSILKVFEFFQGLGHGKKPLLRLVSIS